MCTTTATFRISGNIPVLKDSYAKYFPAGTSEALPSLNILVGMLFNPLVEFFKLFTICDISLHEMGVR